MTSPRITGGRARGRAVAVPDGVRPTSARVREALFSIVGQDLGGLRILDAFGGTGLLGLEAWSRGAATVIVEREPRRAAAIRERARAIGADAEVIAGDVLRVGPTLGPFDGILVDPPYALDPDPIVAALASVARGWLALEASSRTAVAPRTGGLAADPPRVYGDTALWLFRRDLG